MGAATPRAFRRTAGPAAAVLAGLAALTLVASGSGAQPRLGVERTSSLAFPSACAAQPGPRSYHWPLEPFDRQHAVRSNFGDPRTIAWAARLGMDGPFSAGDFSFHNGIDIEARAGTPVYPVASGIVRRRQANAIVVETRYGRKFLYWHIVPAVRQGAKVVASVTVLGFVQREFKHLHFAEVDGDRLHNPLAPGHLTPYEDRTAPSVHWLEFRSWDGLRTLAPAELSGVISVAADASDEPPLPIYGIWDERPIVPALVRWSLETEDGRVLAQRIVADFRRREPPRRLFWQVYADGTYQNFATFDHHYFWGVSGRYLFNLTPDGLDTRRLENGLYRLRVDVADVCGNQGSLTEEVRIQN